MEASLTDWSGLVEIATWRPQTQKSGTPLTVQPYRTTPVCNPEHGARKVE